MRWILPAIIIALIAMGCSTKTTTIKTRPTDEASSIMKNSNIISSNQHLQQGKHLYLKGKYKQATKHLTRSITGYGENWEAHYYLGLCQQKSERFDRSIGSLSKSLKYCPVKHRLRGNIFYALGISWENENYLHKASEKYREAQRLNPELVEAKAALIRIEIKTAKADKKMKKKKTTKAF
ncbi:MAG: hypothetical protein GY841_19360 [FCB group bacterium]|nr:hypothetical protein [FCB group bacterium]